MKFLTFCAATVAALGCLVLLWDGMAPRKSHPVFLGSSVQRFTSRINPPINFANRPGSFRQNVEGLGSQRHQDGSRFKSCESVAGCRCTRVKTRTGEEKDEETDKPWFGNHNCEKCKEKCEECCRRIQVAVLTAANNFLDMITLGATQVDTTEAKAPLSLEGLEKSKKELEREEEERIKAAERRKAQELQAQKERLDRESKAVLERERREQEAAEKGRAIAKKQEETEKAADAERQKTEKAMRERKAEESKKKEEEEAKKEKEAAELKVKKEAEARKKKEAEAREKQEAEAREKQEAEAREKQEAEIRAKKEKAAAEEKVKLEEQREKAELKVKKEKAAAEEKTRKDKAAEEKNKVEIKAKKEKATAEAKTKLEAEKRKAEAEREKQVEEASKEKEREKQEIKAKKEQVQREAEEVKRRIAAEKEEAKKTEQAVKQLKEAQERLKADVAKAKNAVKRKVEQEEAAEKRKADQAVKDLKQAQKSLKADVAKAKNAVKRKVEQEEAAEKRKADQAVKDLKQAQKSLKADVIRAKNAAKRKAEQEAEERERLASKAEAQLRRSLRNTRMKELRAAITTNIRKWSVRREEAEETKKRKEMELLRSERVGGLLPSSKTALLTLAAAAGSLVAANSPATSKGYIDFWNNQLLGADLNYYAYSPLAVAALGLAFRRGGRNDTAVPVAATAGALAAVASACAHRLLGGVGQGFTPLPSDLAITLALGGLAAAPGAPTGLPGILSAMLLGDYIVSSTISFFDLGLKSMDWHSTGVAAAFFGISSVLLNLFLRAVQYKQAQVLTEDKGRRSRLLRLRRLTPLAPAGLVLANALLLHSAGIPASIAGLLALAVPLPPVGESEAVAARAGRASDFIVKYTQRILAVLLPLMAAAAGAVRLLEPGTGLAESLGLGLIVEDAPEIVVHKLKLWHPIALGLAGGLTASAGVVLPLAASWFALSGVGRFVQVPITEEVEETAREKFERATKFLLSSPAVLGIAAATGIKPLIASIVLRVLLFRNTQTGANWKRTAMACAQLLAIGFGTSIRSAPYGAPRLVVTAMSALSAIFFTALARGTATKGLEQETGEESGSTGNSGALSRSSA